MSDLRALTLALPNPVIVIGPDARIRRLNASAGNLIGGGCEGLHYISALRQPAILDAIEACLRDGGHRVSQYMGNDGARETMWEVTLAGAVMSDGLNVVLSFQDLTAVTEASQMRRDFVANVSHEMRTPLTSLLGFIETLRGPARNDPAAQDRFLGIMEQEAGRLHHLVEGLLSLSRVEAQERMQPTTQVDLSGLVLDVLASLEQLAQAKGISLVPDLPETPVEVLGDAEQLRQLIRNLVENSIKYGTRDNLGGVVTVSLNEPRHEVVLRRAGVQLSVRDKGVGIAAHHIARLTERFYRVDSHRSREVGGTGLGLAIVKHIINRHRGRLQIESSLGEGTEITVFLPAKPEGAGEGSNT